MDGKLSLAAPPSSDPDADDTAAGLLRVVGMHGQQVHQKALVPIRESLPQGGGIQSTLGAAQEVGLKFVYVAGCDVCLF